jgi:hypothetical protein
MATVKIKLAPTEIMCAMMISSGVHLVHEALREQKYTESELFEVNGDSADAAEDAFDLTNNPSRQEEREEKYGRGRSLSVGDIVVVGEEQWLCLSEGWVEV